MIELELPRSPDDRRLYVLERAGTLRLEGLFSRNATAEGGGESWHFARSSFWQRVMQATDALGSVVGEFVPRDLRRGGRLHWAGRELTLRPASSWHERYALAESERELVLIEGKSWGRRPVKVTLADPGAIEPGLLLFAAFIVRQLAVNERSVDVIRASAGVAAGHGGGCGRGRRTVGIATPGRRSARLARSITHTSFLGARFWGQVGGPSG